MATLKTVRQKLKKAVLDGFPKAEVRLSPTKSKERVWGFVIWNGFAGEEQSGSGQETGWQEILDKALTKDEQSNRLHLCYLTPATVPIGK